MGKHPINELLNDSIQSIDNTNNRKQSETSKNLFVDTASNTLQQQSQSQKAEVIRDGEIEATFVPAHGYPSTKVFLNANTNSYENSTINNGQLSAAINTEQTLFTPRSTTIPTSFNDDFKSIIDDYADDDDDYVDISDEEQLNNKQITNKKRHRRIPTKQNLIFSPLSSHSPSISSSNKKNINDSNNHHSTNKKKINGFNSKQNKNHDQSNNELSIVTPLITTDSTEKHPKSSNVRRISTYTTTVETPTTSILTMHVVPGSITPVDGYNKLPSAKLQPINSTSVFSPIIECYTGDLSFSDNNNNNNNEIVNVRHSNRDSRLFDKVRELRMASPIVAKSPSDSSSSSSSHSSSDNNFDSSNVSKNIKNSNNLKLNKQNLENSIIDSESIVSPVLEMESMKEAMEYVLRTIGA